MSYWNDIWRAIRADRPSTFRNASGAPVINDARHFKGMSLSRQQSIIDIIEEEQKSNAQRLIGADAFKTPKDIRESVDEAITPLKGYVVSGAGSGTKAVRRVLDSFMSSYGPDEVNPVPQFSGAVMPNLWINPTEAAGIYAGGGVPKCIIDKKSKSIVYNGVRIVNPRLSPKQMEEVNASALRTGLAKALADATRDGLVYGGALLFPMFKRDMPATMRMSVAQLARLGIVEKGSLDHYVVLDRNNAIHIPTWNPTAADFLDPRYYFIPYLGSDVAGERCARIVPHPQAGYWGALMTMGWGMTDIQSWYAAVCNYEGVAQAVPTMIRQMSILVRTFNVDLANALNGATSLRDIDIESMQTVYEASNENPISMDTIGEIKAVQRDFTAVAELTRIVRQDVGAKANLPEEQIWSSDRGAFSSGDQTDGVNERQWEGMKYIHTEIAARCKNIAMLEVINALGKSREVIQALEETSIEFLAPKIENAEKRAVVISDLCEGTFNLVASGMRLDDAMAIVLPYGDEHLAPEAEVIDRIAKHQREVDEQDRVRFELEVETTKKALEAPTPVPGQSSSAPAKQKPKDKGEGYSKLEQRQHEKTRGASARREGIQRKQGKKVM